MAITTNKQLSLTPQKTPALQARGGSFKWSRDSSPVLSQSPININEKSADKCGQARSSTRCGNNLQRPWFHEGLQIIKIDFHCSVILPVRTQVHFTHVNKTETLDGRSLVYVKVEPLNLPQLLRLRMAFHTLPLFYFTHVRTEKLRDSGNQP